MTKQMAETSDSQAPDHSMPDLMAFVDIREAIGDPAGKLMQSEVVERVRELVAEHKVLQQELKQLEGNNKSLIEKNRHLRQRPDLPVDRIPAYQNNKRLIDALQNQVKALQSHPDSYQSGFDDGRASVRAHVDRWKDWALSQAASDRGGRGYNREALGQNNEGDTVCN